MVYIPNGSITSSVIVNATAQGSRRVDVHVETSYDCPTDAVRAALLEAAAGSAYPLSEPAPSAFIAAFNASNIDFVLRVWVKPADYFAVVADLNERIRASYERNNIDISYDRLIVSGCENNG